MEMSGMIPRDTFRHRCRWLRVAVIGAVSLLALLLTAVYVVMPVIYLATSGRMAASSLFLVLVHVLPAVAYLWALWAVQGALGDMAAGRMFQPTLARALRRIGYGVIAGAVLKIFAVSNLSRLIEHTQGGYAYFDLSGIVLAIVGAALILLSRVVEQAGKVQGELDGII